MVARKHEERDVGPPMTLTYAEARTKLNVTLSQLYTLLRSGEIRPIAFSPQVRRIPMSELEDFLERKKAEQWGATPGEAA